MSLWEIRAYRSGFEKFNGIKKEENPANDAPSLEELDQAIKHWTKDGGVKIFKEQQRQAQMGAKDRPIIGL